ncbi:MAG: hypothetical protein ACRCXA_01395 [Peptostreptococcaceae bacterium]
MNFLKKTSAILAGLILVNTINVSSAENNNTESNSTSAPKIKANEILINEWNEYKEDIPNFKTNLKSESTNTYSALEKRLEKSDEGVILHNNGKPIETNLHGEENVESPLYAVYINDDENGNDYISYYYSSEYDIDSTTLLNDVKSTEYKNTDFERKDPDSIIRTLNWTLTTSSGTRVATIATTLEGIRRSNNVDINGTRGSLWDITSVTQIIGQNGRRIDGQRTRLSMQKSSTELLHDWAPDTNGSFDKTYTLQGLLNPMTWKFSAGGYSYKDLSVKADKYGRWQYLAPIIGPAKTVKTNPALRASNRKGQFFIETSHTINIKGMSYDKGGIKSVYLPDR